MRNDQCGLIEKHIGKGKDQFVKRQSMKGEKSLGNSPFHALSLKTAQAAYRSEKNNRELELQIINRDTGKKSYGTVRFGHPISYESGTDEYLYCYGFMTPGSGTPLIEGTVRLSSENRGPLSMQEHARRDQGTRWELGSEECGPVSMNRLDRIRGLIKIDIIRELSIMSAMMYDYGNGYEAVKISSKDLSMDTPLIVSGLDFDLAREMMLYETYNQNGDDCPLELLGMSMDIITIFAVFVMGFYKFRKKNSHNHETGCIVSAPRGRGSERETYAKGFMNCLGRVLHILFSIIAPAVAAAVIAARGRMMAISTRLPAMMKRQGVASA